MKKYERITIGGVPCVRDLRMPVATILSMLADGKEIKDILAEYSELELADIQEVLRYASDFFRIREFPIAV
jgi:uncharacterized protein (DUF433 family)